MAKKATGGQEADLPRLNIVLILADDMGYSDIVCYGAEIATPNIDALARAAHLLGARGKPCGQARLC